MKIKNVFFGSALALLSLSVSCSKDDSDVTAPAKPTKPVVEIVKPTDPEVVTPVDPKPEFTIKTGDRRITSQGFERDYTLRIPKSYKKNSDTPLLVALHAFTGTPQSIESVTQFTVLGEKENFISVYPAGMKNNEGKRFWTNRGKNTIDGKDYDDLNLIKDIIVFLKSELSIDDKRIYLTGNSDGAFMTYKTAFLESNLFAAIAPNGGYSLKSTIYPKPERAIPVMHVHGLKDQVIPPSGIIDPNSNLLYVQPSVDLWVTLNGASETPTVSKDDENVLIREWKSGPNNNADVVYVQAKKGTHQWFNVNNSGGFDASKLIWDFFKAHPKQ